MKTKSFGIFFAPVLCLFLALASCSSDDSNGSSSSALTLTASSSSILEGESVTFTVTADGKEISDFELLANDTPISNPYTFDEEGTYQIIAKKSNYTESNKISITVNNQNEPQATKYEHRVLLEDFTGTWCGPCARVLTALAELNKKDTGKKVLIAAHHMSDAMSIPGINPLFLNLEDAIQRPSNQRGGIPFAVINRSYGWTFPEISNLDQPLNSASASSPIGISINSSLKATDGTVVANITFSQDYQNLKYVLYVLEDNIIDKQNGISNTFSHQDVVKAITSPLGTDITDSTLKGSTIELSHNFTSYKNANIDNLRVLVAILDNDGKVLNVQDAKANTFKDYVTVD